MTISQPKGYSMFCAKDKPEPDTGDCEIKRILDEALAQWEQAQ